MVPSMSATHPETGFFLLSAVEKIAAKSATIIPTLTASARAVRDVLFSIAEFLVSIYV